MIEGIVGVVLLLVAIAFCAFILYVLWHKLQALQSIERSMDDLAKTLRNRNQADQSSPVISHRVEYDHCYATIKRRTSTRYMSILFVLVIKGSGYKSFVHESEANLV